MKNENEILEFVNLLKETMSQVVSKEAQNLIEERPDDYSLGKETIDYYHNGVGFASCGTAEDFDEEQAYEDAWEMLARDAEKNGEDYEMPYILFAENEKLCKAFANLLRSLN